jgi:hypothetical protein
VSIRNLALSAIALVAAIPIALGLIAGTAGASTVKTCEYWTTDEGVSAVVVTSGANCTNNPFTITAAPYDGATFENFNDYLSQIGEYVNGPAAGPSLTGLTKVVTFDNAYTNHIATTVYSGPGNAHDGAAGLFELLLGTGTPY